MDRKEIKLRAKEIIKGNIWNILWPLLAIGVGGGILTSVCSSMNGILSLIVGWAITILTTAYSAYLLKFIRTGEATFNDIFECFKERWVPILISSLLTGLFVFLWSLVFVIPGIVAAFGYALVGYIAVDSDLSGREILKASKDLMNGHKMEYFLLMLSFMGWSILAPLTLGILYIWLLPYMLVSFALFYENLKNQNVVESVPQQEQPEETVITEE